MLYKHPPAKRSSWPRISVTPDSPLDLDIIDLPEFDWNMASQMQIQPHVIFLMEQVKMNI